MARFNRTSNSLIVRWWWTIDRPTLAAFISLICIGAVLVTAASPAVAMRIGVPPLHFIQRQHFFLVLAVIVIFLVSLQSPQTVRRLAILGFMVSVLCLVLLPFIGTEVKGAKRWLTIAGLSLQPSEFLKPCMAVVMSWIFCLRYQMQGFPAWRLAIACYVVVVLLLLLQPDFGMTVTVSAMWAVQFFLAGLPFVWVLLLAGSAVMGIFGAYHFFPHVQKRIDSFLDPTKGDNYQVEKSLEAISGGGWFGKGPGEGTVKFHLPDSHTDFIFSVAAEEFGIIACLIIVMLFFFIVIHGMVRLWHEKDFFVLLAVAGLLTQFGVQAIINMGVAVNLLPAKGMTLPFLSYGGSSLIAIALGMGMMLALTRKRYGEHTMQLM